MHDELERFLSSPTVSAMPWRDARVIEIGAQDVNGATRRTVPDGWQEWTGIDLVAGPGVDYVGDAATVLTDLAMRHQTFDIAVATEVFEHTAQWPSIVKGMIDVLRPVGFLLVTCAAPGRPPHGASGDPQPSEGEHYANVSLANVDAVVRHWGCTVLHGAQRIEWPQDTYLIAVKS